MVCTTSMHRTKKRLSACSATPSSWLHCPANSLLNFSLFWKWHLRFAPALLRQNMVVRWLSSPMTWLANRVIPIATARGILKISWHKCIPVISSWWKMLKLAKAIALARRSLKEPTSWIDWHLTSDSLQAIHSFQAYC